MNVGRGHLQGPNDLARICIHRVQHAGIVHLIHHSVDQHGRTIAAANRIAPHLGLARVHIILGPRSGRRHLLRQGEGSHASLVRGVHILIAMHDDDLVLVQEHRGIHAVLAGLPAPQRLAIHRVHTHHIAAARAGVEHTLAIARLEDGHGERAIHRRRHAWHAPPDQLARQLVERIEAVGSRTIRAPVGADAMQDHQVALDHRRAHAGVREAHAPEIFHHADLPQLLAVEIEAHEQAVVRAQVDSLRRWIDRRRADGVAVINRVAQEIEELVLPQLLARLGIQAGQQFNEFILLAAIAPGEDLAIAHHRRATTIRVIRPSRSIRDLATTIVVFGTDTILKRASPGGPISSHSRQGKDKSEQRGKFHEQG